MRPAFTAEVDGRNRRDNVVDVSHRRERQLNGAAMALRQKTIEAKLQAPRVACRGQIQEFTVIASASWWSTCSTSRVVRFFEPVGRPGLPG